MLKPRSIGGGETYCAIGSSNFSERCWRIPPLSACKTEDCEKAADQPYISRDRLCPGE